MQSNRKQGQDCKGGDYEKSFQVRPPSNAWRERWTECLIPYFASSRHQRQRTRLRVAYLKRSPELDATIFPYAPPRHANVRKSVPRESLRASLNTIRGRAIL